MAHLWSDLRFASRTLRAKPVFTGVAIVSLALGIGANTAIFSVVESALLRPLPFRNSDRLVRIGDHQPCCDSVSLSPGEYHDYRQQTKSFQDIAAMAWQNVTLTGVAEAQALKGRGVTTNFFEVLGAHAEIGRLMSSKIDKPGSSTRVAVLSDGLWRSRFGADPKILGRTLILNAKPFTVIGVLAAHEEYPGDMEVWMSPRVVVPEYAESAMQNMTISQIYGTHWLIGLGRLRPGVPLVKARAEMRTIANRIDAAHQEQTGHWAVLLPLQGSIVQSIRPALAVLGTAVVVLLLIACANLAGLMIARATGRTRELAIRMAVGASRWELTRLLLSESFILASVGGLLGVALAFGALGLLHRFSPYELPAALAPTLNSEVLIFCIAVSFLSALLTGLLPALHASRLDVNEGLKEGSKGSAGIGTQRLRRVLVTGEIALSVVLLIGAFLLIRSFSNLLSVDPGFRPANVTTAQLSLPRSRYAKPEQVIDFWNRLLTRVRALPGVESAGLISDIPLTSVSEGGDFEVEGHPVVSKKPAYSYDLYVSPETIGTLKIPLLSGRDFSARDRKNSTPVVLVNKTFANRFFPGQNAVGGRLRTGNDAPWETIAGVVGNVKWDDLTGDPTLDVYRTYTQLVEVTQTALLVRMHPGVPLPLANMQAAVRILDKDVPLYKVRPLISYADASLSQRRFLLGLLTSFSALAMLLAAIGLYAVLTYSVQQRRQEIGIRVAVGATNADVLWMILRECAVIAGVGVLVGLVSTVWSSSLLKSMLFGISDTDATAYVSAILLIASVALAASAVPALRAARIDPVSALRYE